MADPPGSRGWVRRVVGPKLSDGTMAKAFAVGDPRDSDASFFKPRAPAPGEPSETFTEFVHRRAQSGSGGGGSSASATASVVSVPPGAATTEGLALVERYVAAFLVGLPVAVDGGRSASTTATKLLNPAQLRFFPRRAVRGIHDEQHVEALLGPDIVDVVKRNVRGAPARVVALTLLPLGDGDRQRHLYQSSDGSVTLLSLAHLASSQTSSHTLGRAACLFTVATLCLRVLGLAPCAYFDDCLLNRWWGDGDGGDGGDDGLAVARLEAFCTERGQGQGPHLCPMCLRKLAHLAQAEGMGGGGGGMGGGGGVDGFGGGGGGGGGGGSVFDVIKRYEALAAVSRDALYGAAEGEVRWLEERLFHITGEVKWLDASVESGGGGNTGGVGIAGVDGGRGGEYRTRAKLEPYDHRSRRDGRNGGDGRGGYDSRNVRSSQTGGQVRNGSSRSWKEQEGKEEGEGGGVQMLRRPAALEPDQRRMQSGGYSDDREGGGYGQQQQGTAALAAYGEMRRGRQRGGRDDGRDSGVMGALRATGVTKVVGTMGTMGAVRRAAPRIDTSKLQLLKKKMRGRRRDGSNC